MEVLVKIHVLVLRRLEGFNKRRQDTWDLLVRFCLVCALVGEFTSVETTCPSLDC